MNPLLVILPIILFAALLLFLLFRAFARVWLDHSVRLALLEKIEKKPEMLEQVRELIDIVSDIPHQRLSRRQDYRLTGVFLGLIGAASCFCGLALRTGRFAVGIYIGGFICVGVATLLFLFGCAIHLLNKNPLRTLEKR